MGKNNGTRIDTNRYTRRVVENFCSWSLKYGCPLTQTLHVNVMATRCMWLEFMALMQGGIDKVRGGDLFHNFVIVIEYGVTG